MQNIHKINAQNKAIEIAKLNIKSLKVKRGKLDINIISIYEIDGGIEILAQAWYEKKQLGFGKDGKIDIERFKIYNPPVLVDDKNGEIVNEYTDEITKIKHQRKLTRNPLEAIIQALEHTIKIVGKKNTEIIKGSVGRTTSTFYPEAGTAGSTGDDAAYYSGNASWATFHDASSGTGMEGGTKVNPITLVRMRTTGNMEFMARSMLTFDTSAIPDGDDIDSAVLSIHGDTSSKWTQETTGWVNELAIVEFTGVNVNFTTADYDNFATTKLATNIAISAWDINGYNDFTLNASGLANINKTGISKFGMVQENDRANSAPTNNGTDQLSGARWYAADQTGTADDPKLVVVHSSSTAYTQELTETLTLTESYALQTNKILTEAIILVDSIIRDTAKSIVDAVTLVANHTTQYVYTRAFTDTLTLVDNIAKVTSKTLSDTLELVDNAIKTTYKALSDTVTLVATQINNMVYTISKVDTITLVDTIAKSTSKTLTDTITLVENFLKRLSAIRLTETITLVATIDTVKTNFKAFTETITLTEVFAKVSTYAKSLTESIGLQDRLRGLLNGVNMLYNNKYTAKVVTYINKYIDPK